MAKRYANHSKFIYCDYDEIQDAVNRGDLDTNDIVIARDTKEMILVRDDLSLMAVKSKVYRFMDVESAEEYLNSATDTYEGQLCAIIYQGKYVGYIVNKDKSGRFYVTPLNAYSGQIDYDTLGNRPITNLNGTLDAPVVVGELTTGIYRISGQYKISGSAMTIYLSADSNIFLVEQKDAATYIKIISATDISDYTVGSDGNISISKVATTQYLLEQGYATQQYVDYRIEALNFVTKAEMNKYVSDFVAQAVDTVLDERVEAKVVEKLVTVESNVSGLRTDVDALDDRLDALESSVGDGMEAISEAEIRALFAS